MKIFLLLKKKDLSHSGDNHGTIYMHSLSFIIPPCKTQQRKESFPHAEPDWNQLPQPIVLSGSVETFKVAVSSIKY